MDRLLQPGSGRAVLFWETGIPEEAKARLAKRLKALKLLSRHSRKKLFTAFLPGLSREIRIFIENNPWIKYGDCDKAAEYLAREISQNENYVLSMEGAKLYEDFQDFLVSTSGDRISRNLWRNWAMTRKENISGKGMA